MFGGTCEGEADMEERCNTHECPGTLRNIFRIRILYNVVLELDV